MRIAFFETKDWEQQYLRQRLAGQDFGFYSADEMQKESDVEVLSNFVAFPITKESLESFSKLKYITTRSTGYDHIDLAACKDRGIIVSNVPTYGENTVAEFTFALILGLSRKLYPAIKRVREEGRFNTEGLQGFDLKGKTIGVVGTGHIGEHIVRIAAGFEMEILAYDPHPKEDFAHQYGFSYVSLEELVAKSDIISLHIPYMPETHHIINSKIFKLFKKGSFLINTARGGLVETESLVAALKNGTLAGAGIDVLEEEGFVREEIHLLEKHPNEKQLQTVLADHELMQMDNVIVTPHNAFNSREAVERILDTTISNIQAFAKGSPTNTV